MPQGKGTYGSKVGRPPVKHVIADKGKSSSGWRHEGHKEHNYKHASNPNYDHGTTKEKFDYKGDAKSPTKQLKPDHYKGENTDKNKLKNLSTDQQSHLDKLNKRRKTANTENEYLKFNKKYTTAVDSIHNVNNTPKPASPLEYAPFKMKAADHGNSPMRKNFGIGDSEMPIKTAPVKFGFGGLASKLFGRNKQKQQPEQPQDPMAQTTQAQAQDAMMGQEMAEGGAEGGEVQPHGPEAHTGGAAPIGGAQNKKPQGFMGGVSRFF